ncbi:MAG: deoxyribose-phosphate aldolase [Phycisphaeraceae bacterium]
MPMNLTSMIDHTNLKPEATPGDIARLCVEGRECGFASVCVNGWYVAQVAEALAGTRVKTCAVAGFPLGASRPEAVAAEAAQACRDGAEEVDFVAHLPQLLAKDVAGARDFFSAVVDAVRSERDDAEVKVILETAVLLAGASEQEAAARIEAACEAAQRAGCDFVKTSTGFHPAGGASEQAVRLLKRFAGPMLVKAAGGIRTREDAERMVDAGADRLGCSAGVQIVRCQV